MAQLDSNSQLKDYPYAVSLDSVKSTVPMESKPLIAFYDTHGHMEDLFF